MPKTAFVPIFYVWLGSTYSVYGIAIAIALFITIMMVYNGFQNIDPNKMKLLRTFGATRWQILTKVIIPGSVPTLIATLKISFGLSLVGVVVGEFQSSNSGLGYLILYGSQIFQFNLVMTAITVLAIISGLIYLVIFQLEKAVLRRHA
jgi:NitT/TauT family transport system permease protein